MTSNFSARYKLNKFGEFVANIVSVNVSEDSFISQEELKKISQQSRNVASNIVSARKWEGGRCVPLLWSIITHDTTLLVSQRMCLSAVNHTHLINWKKLQILSVLQPLYSVTPSLKHCNQDM